MDGYVQSPRHDMTKKNVIVATIKLQCVHKILNHGHKMLINNIYIIPGQLGKKIERTFSGNCNNLRDVLKVSVFSYSVLINILLSCI